MSSDRPFYHYDFRRGVDASARITTTGLDEPTMRALRDYVDRMYQMGQFADRWKEAHEAGHIAKRQPVTVDVPTASVGGPDQPFDRWQVRIGPVTGTEPEFITIEAPVVTPPASVANGSKQKSSVNTNGRPVEPPAVTLADRVWELAGHFAAADPLVERQLILACEQLTLLDDAGVPLEAWSVLGAVRQTAASLAAVGHVNAAACVRLAEPALESTLSGIGEPLTSFHTERQFQAPEPPLQRILDRLFPTRR